MEKIKIVAISDLHNHFKPTEGGDLLIIAGDMTNMGQRYELEKFGEYLEEEKKKYKKVIYTPGNHDLMFEKDRETAESYVGHPAVINDTVEFEGLKIFMTPYSNKFGGWAFMKEDKELDEMVKTFPLDVDIIVMHGPPFGYLDMVPKGNVGSKAFRNYVDQAIGYGRVKLIVWGHIHESYGSCNLGGTTIANVAQSCTYDCQHFEPVIPFVYEWSFNETTKG